MSSFMLTSIGIAFLVGMMSQAAKASKLELLVGGAASMQDALKDAGQAYEADNPAVTLRYNFAASSTLVRQIKAGAPIDLIVTADLRTMDELAAADLLVTESRRNIASNTLVVVTRKTPKAAPIKSLAALKENTYKTISICGEAVPLGSYAQVILRQAQVLDILKPRFVYADHVRAIAAQVAKGLADAGFVYATDARALQENLYVAYEIPTSDAHPIVYPVAALKGQRASAAQGFASYLAQAPAAKAALSKYGFKPSP